MTQFEFMSAAVSIVLALSAARLLTALPHVMAPGRFYWVHGVVVALCSRFVLFSLLRA
jgi:hypothetical protein